MTIVQRVVTYFPLDGAICFHFTHVDSIVVYATTVIKNLLRCIIYCEKSKSDNLYILNI